MATTDKIRRVPTGISGLDALIEGGFPEGEAILLRGAPGTGKTIFGLQFLAEGLKKGEKCGFVTLEEPPESIKKQGRQIDIDVEKIIWIPVRELAYESALGKKPQTIEEQIKLGSEVVEKYNLDRVVYDPINSLMGPMAALRREVCAGS